MAILRIVSVKGYRFLSEYFPSWGLSVIFLGLATNTVLRCCKGQECKEIRFSSVEHRDIEGNHFLDGVAHLNNRREDHSRLRRQTVQIF